MTGLLHSLAAHALGRRPVLRPAARLRPGAAAAKPEAVGDSIGFSSSVGNESEDFQSPPVATTFAIHHAQPESGDVRNATESSNGPVERSDRAVFPLSTEPPVFALAPPTSRAFAPPAQGSGGLADSFELGRRPELDDNVPRNHVPRPDKPEQSSPRPDKELPRAALQRVEPRARAASVELKRLDLPSRDRARQESVPQPPDVHIHIGRVELTAVTPPAPRAREGTPARKAMSLDEYLQRRNEKVR